jgi:ADP-ribosylglycohydrolase
MQRFLAWWNLRYNNAFRYDNSRKSKHSVGLDEDISQSFSSYLYLPTDYTQASDRNTSGNGSVMRLSPVPVCFHDNIEHAMEISRLQSLTTHQGDEAKECCALLAHIIVRCINGENVKDILDKLDSFTSDVESVVTLARSEQEGDDPDRNWNWKDPQYQYSPTRSEKQPGYIGSYAMDAVAMALHCVYHTKSAPEAVLKAANLCGDADSVASVAGQIAGAAYGVSSFPKGWVQVVFQWDGGNIALRAYHLFHKKW